MSTTMIRLNVMALLPLLPVEKETTVSLQMMQDVFDAVVKAGLQE